MTSLGLHSWIAIIVGLLILGIGILVGFRLTNPRSRKHAAIKAKLDQNNGAAETNPKPHASASGTQKSTFDSWGLLKKYWWLVLLGGVSMAVALAWFFHPWSYVSAVQDLSDLTADEVTKWMWDHVAIITLGFAAFWIIASFLSARSLVQIPQKVTPAILGSIALLFIGMPFLGWIGENIISAQEVAHPLVAVDEPKRGERHHVPLASEPTYAWPGIQMDPGSRSMSIKVYGALTPVFLGKDFTLHCVGAEKSDTVSPDPMGPCPKGTVEAYLENNLPSKENIANYAYQDRSEKN